MNSSTMDSGAWPRCQVCGEGIFDDDTTVFCRDCGTPHHLDCFRYNRECSTYACPCTICVDSTGAQIWEAPEAETVRLPAPRASRPPRRSRPSPPPLSEPDGPTDEMEGMALRLAAAMILSAAGLVSGGGAVWYVATDSWGRGLALATLASGAFLGGSRLFRQIFGIEASTRATSKSSLFPPSWDPAHLRGPVALIGLLVPAVIALTKVLAEIDLSILLGICAFLYLLACFAGGAGALFRKLFLPENDEKVEPPRITTGRSRDRGSGSPGDS